MPKQWYLHIAWNEKREKNHSEAGDSGIFDTSVSEGAQIGLFTPHNLSRVKEIKEDAVVLDIVGKGEYTVGLNESVSFGYYNGYQVAGDWVDESLTYRITLSEKSLREIKESKPDFEIENGVLKSVRIRKNPVVIPEGVTEIGYAAFKDSYVQEVFLPSTVKKIGLLAFEFCRDLKRIHLPEGLETIDSFAFSYTALEEIEIPSTVSWCTV